MVVSFFRRLRWSRTSRRRKIPRRWGQKSRLSLEQLEDRVVPTLDLTLFELDGNTVDDPTISEDDWDSLYADSGSTVAYTGVIADTPDNTTFTSGSSKDINDLDQWEWGPGLVPNRSDILNAYAAAYIAKDELNVFVGQDRLTTNGSGEVGFWFFQQNLDLNADGTFRGTHTPGDVLVLVNFKGGNVGTVEVYQWDPTVTDNLRLLTSTDDAYGTTNGSPIDAAWRSGIPQNGFFEVGINLTSILDQTPGPDLSFTSFLAESRSSASLNSTLQDFVLASIQFSTGPDIQIVKSVNGDDANAGSGPSVLAGTAVTFTYEVTNTGARALSNTQVVDDNGTPGDTGDDFSPLYLSGDDGNGVLDPGEAWVYTATRTAVVGPYANLATASGTDSRGTTVTDADPAHYFGAQPAIDVEKEVSIDGGSTWMDADTATGPELLSGTNPQFRFTVRNLGNVALDISLSDSNFTLPAEAQPGVLQANDGAPGGADEFVYVYTGALWAAGQHSNTATVEASYTDDNNSITVSDSDAAHYFGIASPDDGSSDGDTSGAGDGEKGESGPPAIAPPTLVGGSATVLPAGALPLVGDSAAVLPTAGALPLVRGGGVVLTLIENPTLVATALTRLSTVPVPPLPGGTAAVPGLVPPLTLEGPGNQPVALAPFVGGGDAAVALPGAEAPAIILAAGEQGTVLPMQPTYETSPGVAFVPEAETFRPLSQRLATGGGAGENRASILWQPVTGKALRLASSMADADDSVAVVEAITRAEAVSGAPPTSPVRTSERQRETTPAPAEAAGPAPGPERAKDAARPDSRLWVWLAGAGSLATGLLLAVRQWWPGRRQPPGTCPE
jgi:hypothetical protein